MPDEVLNNLFGLLAFERLILPDSVVQLPELAVDVTELPLGTK